MLGRAGRAGGALGRLRQEGRQPAAQGGSGARRAGGRGEQGCGRRGPGKVSALRLDAATTAAALAARGCWLGTPSSEGPSGASWSVLLCLRAGPVQWLLLEAWFSRMLLVFFGDLERKRQSDCWGLPLLRPSPWLPSVPTASGQPRQVSLKPEVPAQDVAL